MARRHIRLEEVHNDLRKILYLEAMRIAALRFDDKAGEFLGVDDRLETDCFLSAEFDDEVLTHVDINAFHVTEVLDLTYTAFFENTSDWLLTTVEGGTLQAFLATMPGTDLTGTTPLWLSEGGACIRMARAGVALGKIQAMINGNVGIQGGFFDVFYAFTVRDMAALANMSEGSIRNALVSKRADRLEKMEVPGGQVLIDPVEACRWLSERRGYRSRGGQVRGQGYFPAYVQYSAAKALRWLSLSTYWHCGSVAHTAVHLGWSEAKVSDLLNGRFPTDESDIRAFGRAVFVEPDDLVAGARILQEGKGGGNAA